MIFDCDGVLVDSEVLSLDCLGAHLARIGWTIDAAEIAERFLGRSFATVAEDYRDATGRALPDDFAATFHAALRERFEAALLPIADIDAVLAGLAVPFCLASSSAPERIRLSLRLTGLDRRFEGRIFDASMVRRGKPFPDLFLHAAKAMATPPARCLVIEDSPSGIAAAKAAGMTAWGFVGGSHHARFDGAASLEGAGADHILHRMIDFPPL
ncbi:HAD-IA family hydrolase [Siculibacillus lacustris]|uniref:HAD-IA family hydrolase n=1 Tax=Siculibacillus lacustris TaxID=1549641 RepID=UPI00224937C6|nr:HAD-IA family hydrolase [Siculibacillus lacustris]